MVYLPNEIINPILSFREINPVSLLIKDSVEKCHEKYGFIGSPYYAFTLVYNHEKRFSDEFKRLKLYYHIKNEKLTKKTERYKFYIQRIYCKKF